jgi:hypothetical protein
MTIKNTKYSIHNLILLALLSCASISCNDKKQTEQQLQSLTNSVDSNKTEGIKSGDTIEPGAICTVEDGDGKFGIIKVLVIDAEIAHVKIYKNKYTIRPSKIDLKTLSMGSIYDKDGFGIGHTPLARKGFEEWKPIIIAHESVSEDELEGYKIWKSQ